jgi:hypothetical protein
VFEPLRLRLTKEQRKNATVSPGELIFRWRATEQLHCFVSILPDPRDDRFMIEVGWSTQGRFPHDLPRPELSESRDRQEFGQAECFIPFATLAKIQRGRPDSTWHLRPCSVEPDDPEFGRKLAEEDSAPVSEDRAAARARVVVAEAISDLTEVVVPYLEERVEWERQEIRMARRAAMERRGRVQAEFDARYYGWALDDARREYAAGYPRLRSVTDNWGMPQTALALLDSRSSLDRLRLTETLVKARFRRVLERAGESLLPEEAATLADYDQARKSLRIPDVEAYRRRRQPLDRAAVLAHVKAALNPILGGEGQSWPAPSWSAEGLEWRWETPVGEWTVWTHVLVHGWLCQVTYRHMVGVHGPGPRYLVTDAALLSWLGISRLTTWSIPTGADVPRAVSALAGACADFMAAVPALVADLSPN